MNDMRLTINGQDRSLAGVAPHTRLLDALRDAGLTGAKEGCAEGECGACAVLVARPDGAERTRWTAVNACLPAAAAFEGQEIVTAEGLGTAPGPRGPGQLHPVQQEMATRGGSQCGYCTPGFVCAMAAEYYRPDRAGAQEDSDTPSAQRAEQTGTGAVGEEHAPDHECGPNGFDLHALSGNLCRCTGYRPIRDAAYALGTPEETDLLRRRQEQPAPAPRSTRLSSDGAHFIRPESLTELFEHMARHPGARIVAGATDVGVEVNIRHVRPGTVLAVDRLAELRGLMVSRDSVEIGAGLSLSEVERALGHRVPLLDQLFPQFASRLIRNAATFGGNLGTGSPIGDSAPVLLALGASLVLASAAGEREVSLDEYYTGYRESVRRPEEIIRAVRIPLPVANTAAFHKIAKRRFDDISSVSAAIALQVDDATVTGARIGLGGVAATPLRAREVEDVLVGQPWTHDAARAAALLMARQGTPIDDMRASSRYRSAMLEQVMLKFWAQSQPTGIQEVQS
ncbi:xanthine dehydrogenase small subunit [Kocuria tytonicola]|uniref:Xanthine dehydrogenase small subunit n=1 Tax=Kocuria tytonicola TaxID=2055946 RepID=A0A3L9L4L4_9MICC|nr:FAD binding domain-containing protein [Kocuria tytonicola]RLY93720.1 xanthine dehydrogenase small subunit [Kocuria tytonicola]